MDSLSFPRILYCIYIQLFCNAIDIASYNEISLVHDGWHKNTLSFN